MRQRSEGTDARNSEHCRCAFFVAKDDIISAAAGFEPARGYPIGLKWGRRLGLSAKVSHRGAQKKEEAQLESKPRAASPIKFQWSRGRIHVVIEVWVLSPSGGCANLNTFIDLGGMHSPPSSVGRAQGP